MGTSKPLAPTPTQALPGTERKIQVMANRVLAGYSIWHPRDRRLYSIEAASKAQYEAWIAAITSNSIEEWADKGYMVDKCPCPDIECPGWRLVKSRGAISMAYTKEDDT